MDIFAEIEMEIPASQEGVVTAPQGQVISPTAPDPIRQRFYDMRGMAPDNPFSWNESRLFYKQAKFMEDFADDYEGYEEFNMQYPCFQRMGYEQLRTYFTWRTKVRRGEFLHIDLSYIFLYVYELLSCIGTTSPAQALEGLIVLRDVYAEQFPAINKFLPTWLSDFHIYYELPHSFQQFAEAHNMRDFYSDTLLFDGSSNLNAWRTYSSYDIWKSKFYTASPENAVLMQNCFSAAIAGITALCAEKNVRIKDLFLHTSRTEMTWRPFRKAIFHPWLTQPDRTVKLPNGEVFYCRDNNWSTLYSTPYAHRKDLTGFIIKKTESLARVLANHKTKLTVTRAVLYKASLAMYDMIDINVKEIEETIEKSVAAYHKEQTRVVVNVDHQNLARIREEAEDTTDKLIVEEKEKEKEEKDKTLGALPPIPPQGGTASLTSIVVAEQTFSGDNIWGQFMESLSEVEAGALRLALSKDNSASTIKEFANSHNVMLEILADGINEKALDTVGDNILELTDTLVIYDEYKSEIPI
ncbi:MAG: TerB N-terminal domain-containing protein [Defluviitaleaceae bacterium]|nr:TerB N-terminal domain-containing protein [Defluviitaleaceae bacterium]